MSSDGGWPSRPLGELVDNFDSVREPVKAADRRPGPYPYYGASGIVDYVDDYLFDGEYLLVAEDGENLRTRKTPVAFLARGKFWVNNHAHILRANRHADTRYLAYALSRVHVGAYLTGSTQPKLTQGALHRIPVPAPPVAEQCRIADTLGALDDKIELNRRMNRTLESIARAIFKSWFVDFDPVHKKIEGGDIGLPPDLATLFPASFDYSTMGSVPRGWPVIPLSSLVDVNPKYTLTRGSRVPYVEMSGLPTDAARVTQWRIREFTSGSRFRNGDVLVARITPCLENGKTALVDCLDGDVTAWGSTEFLVLRPHEPVPTEYVYCLSRSDAFRDYAVGSMNGSSGRQRVPVEAIERLPIVRPPDGLLRAFGQVAHSAVSLMAENDRQSESLAALRDCLLPKFLSGDISL